MTAFTRKLSARSLGLGACLMLSGCFVSPGSFTSTLDIRSDSSFTYDYDGQIYMLAMSDLAEMAEEAEGPKPCFDEETGEQRECTAEEVKQREQESQQEREMMRAMMGGLDTSDEEAVSELASNLERQAGWNRVEYAGDGMFNVEFAISSTLGHDFSFPVIEGMPLSNGFVLASLRDGDQVRITAPGFTADGNPFQAMLGGMAGMFAGMAEQGDGEQAEATPDMPQPDGTFRIITDAAILANNTDEGPQQSAAGQVLEWDVSSRSAAAPTALLQLDLP